MFINTMRRDKKTSHRVRKTRKQIYDEAIEKEKRFYNNWKTGDTSVPEKPHGKFILKGNYKTIEELLK